MKCEELKPCTRCRTRNLPCEYASSEAGSAAAMHLLHLSANAHSSTSPAVSPSAAMGPTSRNLGSEVLSSQTGQTPPMQGLPTHAAPVMTNPPYSHSNGSSPSILTNHLQANNEAAQLPTPETLIEQSESAVLSFMAKKSCTFRSTHLPLLTRFRWVFHHSLPLLLLLVTLMFS